MMPAIFSALFAHGRTSRAQGLVSARIALDDGRTVVIRPVGPDDASRLQDFVRALSPLSRRRRFHAPVTELPAALLHYMTDVDQHAHAALLAEAIVDGAPCQVGEARWVRRKDEPDTADFAIAVADDFQRNGLGGRLLDRLEQAAAERGVQRLVGDVLRANTPMIDWLRARGWRFARDPLDPSVTTAELALDGAQTQWRRAA